MNSIFQYTTNAAVKQKFLVGGGGWSLSLKIECYNEDAYSYLALKSKDSEV